MPAREILLHHQPRPRSAFAEDEGLVGELCRLDVLGTRERMLAATLQTRSRCQQSGLVTEEQQSAASVELPAVGGECVAPDVGADVDPLAAIDEPVPLPGCDPGASDVGSADQVVLAAGEMPATPSSLYSANA